MIHNVNWWLMVLSFLLGLVLTLFLVIRRVKREVPEYAGAGAVAAAGAGAGVAGAAKLKGTSGDVEDEPYGAGSIRVKGTATAPDGGWTVKGNEDSMLYHTTDSPSWKQTIAEIWFRDVKDAERAGFARWDSGAAGKAAGAAVAGASGGVAAAKLTGGAEGADADDTETAKFAASPDVEEPYGAGSARVAAGAAAPSGYDIKGNEDSMLYHSPESPSYKVTVAEIWFRDVPTAEAAGFHRWDSGKSQRDKA